MELSSQRAGGARLQVFSLWWSSKAETRLPLQLMQLPEARAGEASLRAARLLVCGRSAKGLSLVGLRHNLPLQQVSRSQGPRSWIGKQTSKQTSVCECTCMCAHKHTCASMYVYTNACVHVCVHAHSVIRSLWEDCW